MVGINFGPIVLLALIAAGTFSTVSSVCFCEQCGINGTAYCSPESLNYAVSKGISAGWQHTTCCVDPYQNSLQSGPEMCPAWYHYHNMTMPAVLLKELVKRGENTIYSP